MKILRHLNIRSNLILLPVAILCLLSFYIVENNVVLKKNKWYDEKFEAATLCAKSSKAIKNHHLGNAEYVGNFNDPNETGLIGFEYSPITSERGSFIAKSTSTNPNFAALVVEYFKKIDIKQGDCVAVGMTGSFPALNIAVCSAIQTLKLHPVIICSVSSSSWGANDPEFTWLDMMTVLKDSGLISFSPVAASIGASQDIGRGLSLEGIDQAKASISRNKLKFIYEPDSREAISERVEIYKSYAGDSPIKAYINVGGGIASLGSDRNGDVIPPGLNESITVDAFADKKGVIYEMSKMGIPIIQMLDVKALVEANQMPMNPIPLPLPGEGKLFVEKRINLYVIIPITVFLLLLIGFIIFHDKRNIALGHNILRSENNSEKDLII